MVKGFMENNDILLEMYLNKINHISLLSLNEEKILIKRISKGDLRAKQLLYEKNLKLVVSIGRKYATNSNELMDIIKIGNKGLMNAVETFDVNKEYGFSVYAVPYIRRTIIDYLISNDLVMDSSTNVKRKGKC